MPESTKPLAGTRRCGGPWLRGRPRPRGRSPRREPACSPRPRGWWSTVLDVAQLSDRELRVELRGVLVDIPRAFPVGGNLRRAVSADARSMRTGGCFAVTGLKGHICLNRPPHATKRPRSQPVRGGPGGRFGVAPRAPRASAGPCRSAADVPGAVQSIVPGGQRIESCGWSGVLAVARRAGRRALLTGGPAAVLLG